MTASFLGALAPFLPTYKTTTRVTPAVEVDAQRLDERDRRRRAASALRRQREASGSRRPTLSILV